MLITLETWDIYDVDLPQIDHTFEEVLNELKDKYKDFSYIEKLITRLPQLKIILPYFYDYIFATNYKDAEKWFIKGLLYFPSSYEAEKVLFSLFDISWWFWIPSLIPKYYSWKFIMSNVWDLIWNIIESGGWFFSNLGWIISRKQIRLVLEECILSENISEIWKNRIKQVQYGWIDIDKMYLDNPWLWDKIIYCTDLPFVKLKKWEK